MLFLHKLIATDLPNGELPRQRRALLLASAAFAMIAFLVTGPLWFQSAIYPKVPLLQIASGAPRWLEFALLWLLPVSWALWLVPSETKNRLGAILFLLSLAGLVCIDQHRLQPWVYQLGILSLWLLIFKSRDNVCYARLLLISIYLFSASSKFDHQFLHTIGQQFADALVSKLGFAFAEWNEALRLCAASLFPIGELIVGVGLLIPSTRRTAAYLAVCLHLLLLLVLGPFGLNHHLGVLCWNGFLVAQVVILFLLPKTAVPEPEVESKTPARWPHLVAIIVVGLPLLEPLGLLDHWPAWQLYAPRNSRVTLRVLDNAINKLPVELRGYVVIEEGQMSPWMRVDLDRWSLDSVTVPVYPQDRFQLGIALAVARRCDLGGAVQLRLQSVSARTTGKRRELTLRGVEEMDKAARSFRWNALPGNAWNNSGD